jgi:hypothetical protein
MPNFLSSFRQLAHLFRVVWSGTAWDHLASMAANGPRPAHASIPIDPSFPTRGAAAGSPLPATPCRADSTQH